MNFAIVTDGGRVIAQFRYKSDAFVFHQERPAGRVVRITLGAPIQILGTDLKEIK